MTLFVVVPERIDELEVLEQWFPAGVRHDEVDDGGVLLYSSLTVVPCRTSTPALRVQVHSGRPTRNAGKGEAVRAGLASPEAQQSTSWSLSPGRTPAQGPTPNR